MRLRRYLITITIGVLLGGSTAARAEGQGVRLGDALILHVGVGLDLSYDSNIFYQSSGQISAFTLLLTPNFKLSNRTRAGTRAIDFSLHGGLNYLEYLTSDAGVSSHRQLGVDAGLVAAFFPYLPYNFTVYDNYVRTTQPPYSAVPYNLNRDTNEAGVRLSLSPGGGRLTLTLGYLFGVDVFEEQVLQDFDVLYHLFESRLSWRFLPKTALYIAVSQGIYNYQNHLTYDHPDSYPFHIVAGLQGLITPKLTTNVWIGYGNGFYVSGPSPSEVTAGAQLGWKPLFSSSGTLGYQHDFNNSLLGSYYDIDQVYASWSQLIWRFTGFVRLSYGNERFQGITPQEASTTTSRTDNLIVLNTRVDYPFKNWLLGSVGYDLQADVSNGALSLGTPAGIVPVNYIRHVVYLRIAVAY